MIPFGFDIVESEHLTETEQKEVERTFRERFFSWPWRPWQKTKTVYYSVPKREIYVLQKERKVICHPAIANELRLQLAEKEYLGAFT
jgi:hypothetical protein